MSFTKNLQNYLKENNHTRLEATLACCKGGAKWSNSITDYRFLEKIGSGSFGQVFKATIDEKVCAIKRICKEKSPNISKILSEVSIHIRLSHIHILQLFNVVEDRRNVYLVMELCHGGSLSNLINREANRRNSSKAINVDPFNPILPYTVISCVLRQICAALAYLHRNHIVHRDLNLNNILLVKSFAIKDDDTRLNDIVDINSIHIKLADFGLAIDCKSSYHSMNSASGISLQSTAAGPMGTTICGTPGFISPEIWTQRQSVSPKSDIYSIGSIVFACISGYTPSGDIVLDNFLPMTNDLITRLLANNPDNRPTLEQILEHIFVSGRINSKRLHSLEKHTKNVHMSIDKKGNVVLIFLKDKTSISVNGDGSRVCISMPNNQRLHYCFYELPRSYWKRYSYLVRFVNLVKAKTAKITVHCGQWFRPNGVDRNNNIKEYISKSALMENGDFEVTLHSEILDESFKFVLDSGLPKNLEQYKSRLEDLHRKMLEVETEFVEMSADLKMDLFPISFGFNDKLCRIIEHNSSTSTCTIADNRGEEKDKILHSIQINGIGCATQFSNGSIKVNFNDGSNLSMSKEHQIFYTQNDILKRFDKNDILPEAVVCKIARMPQVIERLRTCGSKCGFDRIARANAANR